jgi:predicted negative regulator of RcsB-dependent stress response
MVTNRYLRAGRAHVPMGNSAEAIAALQKALVVMPDTQLKPLIEQRLASLGAGETLTP